MSLPAIDILSSVAWISLLLAFFASLVRRCCRTTSSGHYHEFFQGNGESDEPERIHRIDVMLLMLQYLLRGSWVSSLALMRVQGAGWYLNLELGAWFGQWWPLWLALELVFIGVIVLELIPEAISMWIGDRIVVRVLPALDALEKLLTPLTASFRGVRRALLRLIGGRADRSDQDLAEAGIRAAVERGEREGLLEQGEKSMIESVLQFRDAEVVEVMTPRTDMVCFEASETVEEAIPKAIACGHSRIPIYRKEVDEIIGVLYVKDLLRHAAEEGLRNLRLEKVVRKIHFVPETKELKELLGEFRAERFHIAVVLDEYGGTSGLVTIEDILEEIVGEIEDEYDTAGRDQIRKIDERTWDLDGRTSIMAVNRSLGAHIPESDDYETVAGYLFSALGHVPREGEELGTERIIFRVTRADDRKIKRVRAKVQGSPRNDP
ncbi:MAG: hemolysin family protein [Planctomycetota bacterium]|nr:hemolysin family protein [Planctomycetota bacterium]